MGAHVAGDCPQMDALVEEAALGVGAEIEALAVPGLKGVVLGGGYGRGEGGVRFAADGRADLSNDLDFYVVAEEGSSGADIAAIGLALAPVAGKWSARLGVSVDFSPAKTPWRIRHDQERLMVQELLRGFFDVAGEPGERMFEGVARLEPGKLPWTEAARLLMNRGAGLVLALEPERFGGGDFAARNIAKCVLGAGDARLVARGLYRWRAVERAEALGEPLYGAALEWKFRPVDRAVCGWEEARDAWLGALDEVRLAGGRMRPRAYCAARWIARRRTLGELATLGLDPVVRVLRRVERHVRAKRPVSPSLLRDWEVFN